PARRAALPARDPEPGPLRVRGYVLRFALPVPRARLRARDADAGRGAHRRAALRGAVSPPLRRRPASVRTPADAGERARRGGTAGDAAAVSVASGGDLRLPRPQAQATGLRDQARAGAP